MTGRDSREFFKTEFFDGSAIAGESVFPTFSARKGRSTAILSFHGSAAIDGENVKAFVFLRVKGQVFRLRGADRPDAKR